MWFRAYLRSVGSRAGNLPIMKVSSSGMFLPDVRPAPRYSQHIHVIVAPGRLASIEQEATEATEKAAPCRPLLPPLPPVQICSASSSAKVRDSLFAPSPAAK